MSIIPKENEKDILGTTTKRFLAVHAKYITCENISQTGPSVTTGPDAEVLEGINIDSNNKTSFPTDINNDITLVGDFTQTGDMDITGTFTVSSTMNTLTIITSGKLEMGENIDLGANFINGDGSDNKGLTFSVAGTATFKQDVDGQGSINASDEITAGAYLQASTHCLCDYLRITDGRANPSAIAGQASIFVSSADGDLKIRFGDGTIKTIVTDT
jgi:hypothetical protein